MEFLELLDYVIVKKSQLFNGLLGELYEGEWFNGKKHG